MKAIVVVDVEEYGDYYVDVYRKDDGDRFEGRYYLKPLPQKGNFEIDDDHPFSKAEIMAYTYGITVGRNQIIKEITE